MAARMFTAVLPPRDVVEELDRLLDPRREADSSLRWTRPDGWHVTTTFMASVDRYRLDTLEENLAEVASRTAPFPLALAGGVTFPDPMKARVLALAVGIGHEPLAAVAASTRSAANRAGVDVDGARYVGHMTLARHHRGVSAKRWLEVLSSFPVWEWTAEELVLIESHQIGRRYDVVQRFPLATTGLD
ncbi:MAG: RNA 2',3'-cyclic phosphodiesterase [Tessaracoccus sp.]|uniref:RNA 2',3'-cyclic phosphodiesterase n=1 Tax=Tessaracoccus sp. TaxID=1971211 RepID=UPI001ECD5B2B|nr:RNA 2',3'-cyclic phosphodiesterase [Tessaracoccus sp.]MBK7821055.1 RNA 2',3'-cyclic phosphodiesterase [Tessaracoccus sp.]